MRQLEDAMTKNNFVKATDRLERSDPNYGRPQVSGETPTAPPFLVEAACSKIH